MSLKSALFLGAVALLCTSAPAADWPQWCGTDGKNMVSQETGIPDSFAPGKKNPAGGFDLATARNVKWCAHIGAYTVSSPTIAGDRIFIGSTLNKKGVMKCLDAKTGKLVWQWISDRREVPDKFPDGRGFPFSHWQQTLGVCSTAAYEDGRIYFVSQRGEVMCLDAAGDPAKIAERDASGQVYTPTRPDEADTSRVIWQYDMYEDLKVRPSNVFNSSPLIHGDFIYLVTSNGVDRQPNLPQHDELRKPPSPDAPSVIVLEKKTGRLVAMDDIRMAAGPRMLHGNYSSLSLGQVAGKTMIFFGGGDGILYAFEALTQAPKSPVKLKQAWSCDCIPKEFQEAHKARGIDMIMHYCQGDKRRADSTNKKNDGSWIGMCEFIATPVFHDGRVYIAIGRDPDHGRGRGALWCIDPTKTGNITESGKVWVYRDLDRSLSTVSIAGGLLYVSDMAGRVHCVDPATGKPYWVHETKAEVWGSTLVVDGKVLLPTHKGLFVLAAGKEARQLGKIELGSQMYCSPVVAGGTLYVASRNYLWAVEKEKN